MAIKLKALGLALAAAFALSAVAATAASAQTIHSGSDPTFLTGLQVITNELDTPSGNIKCTGLNAPGTFSGSTTTNEITVSPTYSGCTAFGLEAHIDMMGCDYKLVGKDSTTAVVHIICPTTAGGMKHEITITPTQGGAAICHIAVPEQTINIKVHNTEAKELTPDDVHIAVESPVTYTVERTVGGSKCPTNGTHTDGVYTGQITVKGFANASHTVGTGLTYT